MSKTYHIGFKRNVGLHIYLIAFTATVASFTKKLQIENYRLPLWLTKKLFIRML